MSKLRLAVVGAGPAGIYASDLIIKAQRDFDVSIDLFDLLPAPYGLVRYGVAPDHPRIKGIIKALYEVLSKIYALALQVNISDYRDSILKELRNQLSLKKKIKTQKNSNAITMLVRWVVGANRQTAHNYSKALQAAFNDNITAANISAYFTERGGLQSVKSEGQKKTNEAKDAINSEFERFVQNVDSGYKGYSNTKIEWTEEIYGEGTTGEMMILGHWSGSSMFTGYRAFHLSKDAYHKICKILAAEVFKNQSIEAVSEFIDAESKLHYEIAKTKQNA